MNLNIFIVVYITIQLLLMFFNIFVEVSTHIENKGSVKQIAKTGINIFNGIAIVIMIAMVFEHGKAAKAGFVLIILIFITSMLNTFSEQLFKNINEQIIAIIATILQFICLIILSIKHVQSTGNGATEKSKEPPEFKESPKHDDISIEDEYQSDATWIDEDDEKEPELDKELWYNPFVNHDQYDRYGNFQKKKKSNINIS